MKGRSAINPDYTAKFTWDKMRHKKAPLYEAVRKYADSEPAPFHVPGHKLGGAYDSKTSVKMNSIFSLDVTELSRLDDLHQAEGVIAEAQHLAAEAFRAEETFFLVGGSTAGNIAAILTVCNPGDTLIVQRNVHKSVIHALMLGNVHPIFINPMIDHFTGIATGITAEQVAEALIQNPHSRGVFITNPNYYGMGTDIRRICEICHSFGVPILVDEAHGAHFGFHTDLPESAMDSGADLSVQSTHKMLTSLTMSSMLHIQGHRIDRDKLRQILAMIQSSSPSYPLMISLDLARRYIVLEGQKKLDQVIQLTENYRGKIRTITPDITVPDNRSEAYDYLDPLKIVMHVSPPKTGYMLQQELEEKGCFAEMADLFHVVLALSPETRAEQLDRLISALHEGKIPPHNQDISSSPEKKGIVPGMENVFKTHLIYQPFQVFHVEKEWVPWDQAAGRVCADSIIPYPPGIPVFIPGEYISNEKHHWVDTMLKKGGRIQGLKGDGPSQMHVLVVQNHHEKGS